MQNKGDRLIFIPLFIFIILALIRLSNPLQFWVDEMFHVFAGMSILESGQPILPSGFLYERSFPVTLLVAGSFKLLGISEVSARLPFLVIGIFSIIVTYYFIKGAYDRDTAFLGAFLLSISPLQIHWSLNARMYILLQFLYMIFLFVGYRFFKEIEQGLESRDFNKNKLVIFSFLLIGIVYLSSFVHYFYLLFIAAAFAFLTYLVLRKLVIKYELFGKEKTLIYFIVLASFILMLIRVLFPYLPFIPAFAPIGMQLGIGFYGILLARYFTILSIFAALSVLMYGKKENYSPVIIIGFFVPFILLTIFLDAKNSRYLFFAFPLFIAMASNGIIEAWNMVKTAGSEGAAKYLVISLIALLAVQTGIGIYSETFDDYQPIPYEDPHPHWKLASEYVQNNLKNDEIVLSTMPICTQYYLGKTDYWLRQNEYYSFEDDEGVLRDRYTGAVILKDYDTFRDEIKGRNGWLIADRKLDSYFTDPGVLEDVYQNMTFIPEGSDDTIAVYRFEYK